MSDKNNALLEIPMGLMDLMVTAMKRNTETSVNFIKEMEKNQRDFIKASVELMNTTLPGEAKLWGMQTEMLDKGLEVCEKSYEKLMSVWKN